MTAVYVLVLVSMRTHNCPILHLHYWSSSMRPVRRPSESLLAHFPPYLSMTRLPPVILGSLRRLLSSGFVTRSIKCLLFLFSYLRRLFTKKRATQNEFIRTQNLTTDFTNFAGSTTQDVICYSSLPASLRPIEINTSETNSLAVPNDQTHGETLMTNIVHAPTPQPGHLLPYAYVQNASSRSSQAVAGVPDSNRISIVSENTSIRSRRSNLSALAIDLPVSNHGLVQSSPFPHPLMPLRPGSAGSQRTPSIRPSRPNSRISNASGPLKVSRAPSPAPPKHFPSPIRSTFSLPANDGPYNVPSQVPDGRPDERADSPQGYREIHPMPTASVRRWDRNVIV